MVCLADLRKEVAPPTQKRTVASSRHAVAAHMKPKLYFPRSADLPMERKLRRPRTYAALMERIFVRSEFQLWGEDVANGVKKK